MKILILSDFNIDDRHSRAAKAIGKKLKNNGWDLAYRCINNTYKENDITGINFVLQFLEKHENCIQFFGTKIKNFYIDMENLERDILLTDINVIKIPHFVASDEIASIKHKKLNIKELAGNYVFYTMNKSYDYSTSPLLIKKFLLEFDPDEPVKLVIVTDRQIDNEIINIKKSTRKYNNIDVFSKQIVIHGNLTLEQRVAIHNACDCFIQTDLDECNYLDEVFGLNKPEFPIDVRPSVMRDCYVNKYNISTWNNSSKYYSVDRSVKIVEKFLKGNLK